MKGYTVYRVDCRTGRREPIGSILERRERERPTRESLLRLLGEARRLFELGREEAISIVLDAPQGAVEVRSTASSQEGLAIASR